MRVETREAAATDVRARLDPDLEPGEVRRDDGELRVGAPELPGFDGLRSAAAHAARALRRDGGSVAWQAGRIEEVRAVIEGTAYGAYDPGLFKQRYAERPELTLVVDAPADLHAFARRQEVIARHLDAARDLGNRPPNDLTPETLAHHARGIAGDHLTVEAHGRLWIEAHEMGAFAAVAAGSPRDPQLICMRYDPPNARADVTLGLVGKAVTFDSGGVSLKPPLRMQDLKGDMCGGAAVIEATAAIAELGLPLRVLTVVAATENVQGGSAFKPGDILRASNGKTIEIVNTDAEGRLILADALHYARSQGATHVADFATLTGAMSLALGDLYAGWFCTEEAFAAAVERASEQSGELLVRFPLHPRYRRYIDSDFADLKNASELREGAPILAAEFLHEFAGDGAWAHFDISPAYLQRRRPDYALDQGGTGYGVRLIVELAEELKRVSLDFDLDDEHELLRNTVRQFALEKVAPVAEELDREKRFPYDLVAEMADLGLMGMTIPEEYGGGGTDTLAYAIAIEELTRIDSSIAITVAAHHSLGTLPIYYFGSEEQKRQWLPDLASGKKLAAFGLTESNAGSDAGATQTTARLDAGEWVVDGSKMFITNAGTDITSCVTITAVTGDGEISNIVVPNGTPGYVISAPMQKLGWRASDTRELSFQSARVPEGNLLGPRGQGFQQFLEILDGGRISIAAMGVGLAQGAYDLAFSYAKEREQFGKPIATFQAVQTKLVDMATEIEAARLLVWKAAWEKDQGRDFRRSAAMAKLFSGELSHRAANWALQIHGGYGFMDEYPISRLYRDQKILEIGEGTNEVQRMVIARHLGL